MLFLPPFFAFAESFKVRVSGNKAIKKEEILSLAKKEGFSVSDFTKKLIAYYKDRGYLYAEVKILSNKENNIEVLIDENEPISIGNVSLKEIKNIHDPELRSLYAAEALNFLKLKKGDILEKSRIEKAMLSFKKWLLENDFLFSKNVSVETNISAATKTANLLIKADYGLRVKVGFRNNKEFTKKELKTIISEEKEFSSQENYINAILNRLKRKYKEEGFVNAKITPIVRTDSKKSIKSISFSINEGKRVRINDVNFSGIHSIGKDKLLDFLSNEPYEFFNNKVFHEGEVEKAGASIEKRLKENGYLSANLNFVQTNFNKDRESVRVKFLFTEGPQTMLNSLKLKGLNVIEKEDIWEILKIKKDQPFNIFSFEEGLNLLKEKYYNLGYLDFKILNLNSSNIVQYSSDQSKANILLQLSEGAKIRLRDIKIEGNRKTKDKVIRREIPLEKGDVLRQDLIRKTESNLQDLDLFNLVSVRLIEVEGDKSVRDMLIKVEDGLAGILEFGPGFRNDLGLRFFAAVSYRNLGGWNRSITVDGFVNRRLDVEEFRFLEYNINLGFKEPYFFGKKIDFLLDLIFLKRQLNTFDVDVQKINLELNKKISRALTVFLQYSYEKINTFNAIDDNDNESSDIASLSSGFHFDSTDSSFNPGGGFRSTSRIEWAAPVLGSEKNIAYHKLTSNNILFLPIPLRSTLKLGLNFGFERSNIRGQEIPSVKLFRLGGTRSIRGYREDGLEVDNRLNIEGTLSFLNYRTEIQIPLEDSFAIAFFWDAGNLYVDRIKPFDLRQSTGTGLRYRTPVGPISLDYARKLGRFGDRDDGINAVGQQDRYRIHLSIGSF